MPKSIGVFQLHQILSVNPPVREVPESKPPTIDSSAVIGAHSIVIGDVTINKDVFVGFHNVIRADSSHPFYIGQKCNIQDFVLMHCHPEEYVTVQNRKMGVFIEENVSILHHAAPHGPLFIGRNTFIGQHASIYGAIIGRNCVVMHGAVISDKVQIPDSRFVAPGQAVFTQEVADKLPEVPSKYKGLNEQIVDHYFRLGKSYRKHTQLMV